MERALPGKRKEQMKQKNPLSGCVVVAHPDDETIWTGGLIIMRPEWRWTVISLCRGGDPERAPKFQRAAVELGATAVIGDLDDGPEQAPLSQANIQDTIISLLPSKDFDLMVTHSPRGEYTINLRHEETGAAVAAMWKSKSVRAPELWMFAYRDHGKGGKDDLPGPIRNAHFSVLLPKDIFGKKCRIITDVYGFSPDSYEAFAVQKEESFWRFASPIEYDKWLESHRRSE